MEKLHRLETLCLTSPMMRPTGLLEEKKKLIGAQMESLLLIHVKKKWALLMLQVPTPIFIFLI